MDLIVVIQNEPRDGDIAYLEKDMEAFKKRIVELDLVEAEDADELVVLGVTYYWDDEDATIVGHEVKLPYPSNNLCADCFNSMEDHREAEHKVGETLVVNFVEAGECEACKGE